MLLNRESLCLALARLLPGWAGRQLHNPVFLIGVARSGTTVLADLFVRRWWADTPPEYRRAVHGALGVYQFFSRRPVLLNKSPMHTFRVAQMMEMIPEARFVYLVRDGRAVIFSYAGKISAKMQANPEPFRREQLALPFDQLVLAVAEHWMQAQRQYASYKATLSAGQLLALRYEDLCAEPRQALSAVLEFVGVSPDHFDWARTRVLENRNSRWRQALPETVWREAERVMAEGLACWGYDLS
jgi:hypothetical protein